MMSNLQRYYTYFLSLLHNNEPNAHFLNQVREPKISDKEPIALNLVAEATGIDSELYLFTQLPDEVKNRIESSVYNRRRRNLIVRTQRLQQRIADNIIPQEIDHLIGSMPLEMCKFSRANRSRICFESIEKSFDFTYCAAQKRHYFAYQIHAVCTQQGVFKVFDIFFVKQESGLKCYFLSSASSL